MAGFAVDASFARFGSARYVTDKITSFRVEQEGRKVQGSNDRFTYTLLGVVGVMSGLAFAAMGVSGGQVDRAIGGIIAAAVGGWMLRRTRSMSSDRSSYATLYRLILVTNAGEVAAYETTSAGEIESIEAALEQAILEAKH